MACDYRLGILSLCVIWPVKVCDQFQNSCCFNFVFRASRSIEIAVPTADYEVSMTKVFCQEAHQRAKTNLESIKDSKCLEIDGKLKTLSEDICSNGGVVQSHPLGF